MKKEQIQAENVGGHELLPSADALAALRAWYEGLPAREAVVRYLGQQKADGQSSRGMLGATRRQLAAVARSRRRSDLADLFISGDRGGSKHAHAVVAAIETLRATPMPVPQLGDEVANWFGARIVGALHDCRIKTLADLTIRVPRRRMWWRAIPGLGMRGARSVEAFFAEHPDLTERARALALPAAPQVLVPWEKLAPPQELDGSNGVFRAPRETCALSARNDHQAVTAWLERHESLATQRAYRKEAERLILWALIERGKPLSSLTAEDATAYRAFLRRPTPQQRWIGPTRPRHSIEWRPFGGALCARSIAYSLGVLSAMFRWLIEQRYVLSNPFSGLKVRGASRGDKLDAGRSFSQGEWKLIRTIADGLEWSYGWSEPAAQRLRFLLDFSYSTGLRASELVGATLGWIQKDDHDDHWLEFAGKGARRGRVVLPSMARAAIDQYLVQRGLPVTRSRWDPTVPLVGRLDDEGNEALSGARLWAIVRRFFCGVAEVVRKNSPALAEKLTRASPHWMRHTHATHSLERGAELTTVRDNLRHASIGTTSIYLHSDQAKRARQLESAFPMSKGP